MDAVTVNVADVPSVTEALSAAMEISGVVGAAAPGHVSVDATSARLTFWPMVQLGPPVVAIVLVAKLRFDSKGFQENDALSTQSLVAPV